jgi:para-nitrobenzyl esterase
MRSQNNPALSRRKFLAHTSIGLAAAASTSLIPGRLTWARPSNQEIVEVKTAYGRLRGKRAGDVIAFKGVPYAGSVSGENRFKAAPPLQPLDGHSRCIYTGSAGISAASSILW